MTEKICKYCKHFEKNESYCNRLNETKSQKSTCYEFIQCKFPSLRWKNDWFWWTSKRARKMVEIHEMVYVCYDIMCYSSNYSVIMEIWNNITKGVEMNDWKTIWK